MLLYNKIDQPIFLVGSGPYAKDLESWMKSDGHNQVISVSHEDLDNVPLNSQVMLAFVNMQYRKKFFATVEMQRYNWPAYVHSSALVTDLASISPGVIVNPMSVLCNGCVIQDFCLIGTQNKIGHETHLGRNTVTTSGTIIGGSTRIGCNVFFAQSCSVKDKITVCDDVYFAMNSVVKKDIVTAGRYYGDRRMVEQ